MAKLKIFFSSDCVTSHFLCFIIMCVNCISLFLCDDALHKLGSLHARVNIFCILTTTESRESPVASVAVHSKAMVLLLIHCLLLLQLFVGVLCLGFFCYAVFSARITVLQSYC